MRLIIPQYYGFHPQNIGLQPEERLNEARLIMFLTDADLGVDQVLTISSETAVKKALEIEDKAKDLPVSDYNKHQLHSEATKWVKLAVLLENREKYFDRLKPTEEVL